MLAESPEKTPKKRVLVVDDSDTNRLVLRTMLSNYGYEVDEAASGQECLTHCAKELPTMIFMDIMMPEIDGISACKKLREVHSKVELPIIMVTTRSETEGLAQCLAVGANDYVTKPIDRSTLLARTENQLALAEAHQQIESQARVLESALKVQSSLGDVLPEALLVHDGEGKVIYSNLTCAKFCGGKPSFSIDEVIGTIFEGKYQSQHAEIAAKLKTHPNLEVSTELSLPDGKFQNIMLLTKPIENFDNPLRMWLWRDESATRDLERSVNQRIKLETVGLFAAGVAHNFNNIMGGILGATEVLERIAGGGDRAKRCLGVIKRGVDGGISLTRKMRAVYHSDVEGKERTNDVAAVLEGVLGCYMLSLDQRITFDVEIPPSLPRVTLPDQALMEVFGNIVSNAVDAIPGKGEIKVSVRVIDEPQLIAVTIRDSGVGMSKDVLEKIFEPFYSTKNFDKLSGVAVEGRGLGLWNTYNILQACGGSIDVGSELGKGTTVILMIPVHQLSIAAPVPQL